MTISKYEFGDNPCKIKGAFDELKKLIVEFLEEDEYMPSNQRELIEKALDEVGECIYGEFSCRFGQKYSRLTPREE